MQCSVSPPPLVRLPLRGGALSTAGARPRGGGLAAPIPCVQFVAKRGARHGDRLSVATLGEKGAVRRKEKKQLQGILFCSR